MLPHTHQDWLPSAYQCCHTLTPDWLPSVLKNSTHVPCNGRTTTVWKDSNPSTNPLWKQGWWTLHIKPFSLCPQPHLFYYYLLFCSIIYLLKVPVLFCFQCNPQIMEPALHHHPAHPYHFLYPLPLPITCSVQVDPPPLPPFIAFSCLLFSP